MKTGADMEYKRESWFLYLLPGMRTLASQSLTLLAEEKAHKHARFDDYSFILFSIAKCYEGFLKQYFWDLGLITEDMRDDPHFRIGRSLNPDLPDKYKDETWLYDDLQHLCDNHGVDLARKMWRAWVEGRNRIFHYFFPYQAHRISLAEAEQKVNAIVAVMKEAVECGIHEHAD